MALRPLLSNVAVKPAYRRRGIATSLVARCEALACEWGFDELLLLVEEGNAPARALYASRGYDARLSAGTILAAWSEGHCTSAPSSVPVVVWAGATLGLLAGRPLAFSNLASHASSSRLHWA